MSRTTKWKLEKLKVKVVFRLQFHATQIPPAGWDKLFVSLISVDSGKVTAKTSKSAVRNGTCKWGDPIYETTRLLQDTKTKQLDEKLYKLIVAMFLWCSPWAEILAPPLTPPSLVQLCTQTAIKYCHCLGDVGDTETEFLKDILPHCNDSQLMHIEKSSQGRDLSSITNDLWQRFFLEKYGSGNYDKVLVGKTEQEKGCVKWREQFELKMERLEKIKQDYRDEVGRKQRGRIQICTKIPGFKGKRKSEGGGGGNLMKKAKKDYFDSLEARNRAVMRKEAQGRTNMAHS